MHDFNKGNGVTSLDFGRLLNQGKPCLDCDLLM